MPTDGMRLAVLASPDAWHYRDLKRAAAGVHEVVSFPFETLAASVGATREFNLDADCVIVRTMPPGSLQEVVFRMDLLGQLAATGSLVLNSPKSIEIAVDKYLSLAKLNAAGIPVPATFVSQDLETALQHFERLGGDVVVKPLFGSMGNGIHRIQSLSKAKETFESLVESASVIYQQEFVPHAGFDLRLLVIGSEVLGMKRINADNWITNISQGGKGEPYLPTPEEKQLAIESARAVGAHFAGVDLVVDQKSGRQLILEVNAVPGWRAISNVLDVDVAKMFISEIEELMSEKDSHR